MFLFSVAERILLIQVPVFFPWCYNFSTDSTTSNKMSGDIVYLKRKGGSYVLEVEFVMEAGGDGNAVFQRQGR